MSVRTHASSWRSLLAFAPALGAAFIVMGALQGEPAILLSRTVYLVLLPVSLAGWWIARQPRPLDVGQAGGADRAGHGG